MPRCLDLRLELASCAVCAYKPWPWPCSALAGLGKGFHQGSSLSTQCISFPWALFMLFPFPGTFLPHPADLHTAWLSPHPHIAYWSLSEFLSSPSPFPPLSWGHSSSFHGACFGAPHCTVGYTPRFRMSVLREQRPRLVPLGSPNTRCSWIGSC